MELIKITTTINARDEYSFLVPIGSIAAFKEHGGKHMAILTKEALSALGDKFKDADFLAKFTSAQTQSLKG